MIQEDDTSPWYFTFGSFWSGIQQVRMSDPLHVHDREGDIENINNIIRNSTATNPAVVEGATTTKYGPWYFLFFSVGQCCRLEHELMPAGDEYRIAVCRAEQVSGPYYDRDGKSCVDEVGGTTILASHGDVYAPGGQGVMEHPTNGKMVLYYHYSKISLGIRADEEANNIPVRPSIGYAYEQFFFGWNYLDFFDGWPLVV
jgi:arabinan endo-1,5-alpha-L-arabinosidase